MTLHMRHSVFFRCELLQVSERSFKFELVVSSFMHYVCQYLATAILFDFHINLTRRTAVRYFLEFHLHHLLFCALLSKITVMLFKNSHILDHVRFTIFKSLRLFLGRNSIWNSVLHEFLVSLLAASHDQVEPSAVRLAFHDFSFISFTIRQLHTTRSPLCFLKTIPILGWFKCKASEFGSLSFVVIDRINVVKLAASRTEIDCEVWLNLHLFFCLKSLDIVCLKLIPSVPTNTAWIQPLSFLYRLTTWVQVLHFYLTSVRVHPNTFDSP